MDSLAQGCDILAQVLGGIPAQVLDGRMVVVDGSLELVDDSLELVDDSLVDDGIHQ